MREADVPAVQEIERRIFSTPWPRNAYYRELSSRNSAYYIVLRREVDCRRLFSDDEGEFWDEVRDELAIRAEGFQQRRSPPT